MRSRTCREVMSTLPDNELDLEKLFLPAWAQEGPSAAKYAQYEGETERAERRNERRGPRPFRRDSQPRGRRFDAGKRKGEPGSEPGHQRGASSEGRYPGRGRPERREPPQPLPEINVSLVPEERGVESLSRQIKMTGRAYPLFDIAQMILQKPERHAVVFSVKKNPEGQLIQPLFLCALDETLWLSEDEAVAHVMKKHFSTFYQAERTPTEPPKGKYTFVAQCGMSGAILGPPNYHDYQNQLHKLHAERFSRMPFEAYKARVKIVRDEEVVKKWVEEQSFKTDYVCLNMPEPLRLSSLEAVEKHFRENHKDNIIKPVESHTLSGPAARALRSTELTRLARCVAEDQRRFPLQIATVLSQQFAGHGLQFFKVNKTITHVCVARPHYLDLSLIPVSEGVKRIVEYINANPRCTRRKLIETLAPVTQPPPQVPVPAEGLPPSQAQNPEPTLEQNAVNSDLHWLIHQGHVIEFANGTLETAKKPLPKPPKPPAQAVQEPAEAAKTAESAAVAPSASNTMAGQAEVAAPQQTSDTQDAALPTTHPGEAPVLPSTDETPKDPAAQANEPQPLSPDSAPSPCETNEPSQIHTSQLPPASVASQP